MPFGGEYKIREAIDIALKYQGQGRLRAAGNIYRRVLRVEPENPDALHFLGVIAHKIGRPDLAMELLARSIAADPVRVGFRLNLGSLYLKRQQVDEAVACYRDAIALDPTSASAYAHLAAALARQGKLEEANHAYNRATELKALPHHAIPEPVEPTEPVLEPDTAQPAPAAVAVASPEPEVRQAEPGLSDALRLLDEPPAGPAPEADGSLVSRCAQVATTSNDEHASACHPERGEEPALSSPKGSFSPVSEEALDRTQGDDLEPSAETSMSTDEHASECHPERSEEPALSLQKGSLSPVSEETVGCAEGAGLEPSAESSTTTDEHARACHPERGEGPALSLPKGSHSPVSEEALGPTQGDDLEPSAESSTSADEHASAFDPERSEGSLSPVSEETLSCAEGGGLEPSAETSKSADEHASTFDTERSEGSLSPVSEEAVDCTQGDDLEPSAESSMSADEHAIACRPEGSEGSRSPVSEETVDCAQGDAVEPSAETSMSTDASACHPERSEEPALSLPKGSLSPVSDVTLSCAEGGGQEPSAGSSTSADEHATACDPDRSEEPALSLPKGSLSPESKETLDCAPGDGLKPSSESSMTTDGHASACHPEGLGIFSAAGAPTGGFAAPGSFPSVRAPAALATFSRSERSQGALPPVSEETLGCAQGDGLIPSTDVTNALVGPSIEIAPEAVEETLEQQTEVTPSEEWKAQQQPFLASDMWPAEELVEASVLAQEAPMSIEPVVDQDMALEEGPVEQPSVPAVTETVLNVTIDFVIPVEPEAELVEQPTMPPVAEVVTSGPIDFVIPVEPQDSRLTTSGESAAHAARAALALQYAWALHFDPAHPFPSPAGGAFGINDQDADPAEAVHEPAPVDTTAAAWPADSGSQGPVLPLPDPDPVEPEQAAKALTSGIDDAADRVAWMENSGPTLLPPVPHTSFEGADYIDLGLPDDPALPLAERTDRHDAEDAAAEPEQMAAAACEDEAEGPFEPDDDALESLGAVQLEGEPIEDTPLESPEPSAQADPAKLELDVERAPDTPGVFIGSSPAELESAGPSTLDAVPIFDLSPAGPALSVPDGVDTEEATLENVPSAFLVVATDSGVVVEAVHVRPGLLGEAHEQVLSGHFEPVPGGGVKPPVDRSAETLPLPGAPALRSFRGPTAPAPAGRGRPPSAESLRRRGVALVSFRRLDEAVHLLNRAVALRPKFAEAHRDLGGAMLRQGNLEGAIASLQRALKLRPTFAEAWGSLGDAYQLEGKISQAIRCYRRLLELVPRAAKVHSNMLLSMNYDSQFSAQEVFHEHVRWAERHAERHLRDIQPHTNDRTPNRRLMIGYVSPDFRRHSVNYFAEPVLAGHHRPDFHVSCYSDVVRPDGVTRGLADLSDHFRDTHAMNDEQLAAQIRADGIDILVDLSGHTGNNRLGTFARKPAPIQVTYLGYPNTTGLSTIDYRITDALADPPGGTERFHSEHLVRLPDTFLCYQPPHGSPEVGPLPCLKAGYVTFGCFNILAKITDQVMSLWARVMQELPNSRLVLKGRSNALSGEKRRQHVRDIFVNHGISPDRLELLGKEPSYAQHLTHYSRLDIVLDPFPYNGTTTTCEALWMGLPVVTLAGDRHVSRVGVSILTNVGLPELIAATPEQYVRIATSLADSPGDLSRLRSTLRDRMHRSPLTDSIRLTRALEAEYRNMWVDWCQSDSGSPAPRDTLRLTDG